MPKFRFLLIGLLSITNFSYAQIYYLAELSSTQIDSFNRNQTVIIIPAGVMEQHGPYLPVYSDGFQGDYMVREVAKEIITQTKMKVLIFPSIPLGVGEPEDFAPRAYFGGSLPVRPETQRAIFMDLASVLGDNGFKWIFIVHWHGPQIHQRMLDQASEYFEAHYKGTMVNLTGLQMSDYQLKDKELIQANRCGVHADVMETSRLLFIRPDLVKDGYKNARTITATDCMDLSSLAKKDEWPGYFGAPRYANAGLGAKSFQTQISFVANAAVDILNGKDHKEFRRWANVKSDIFGQLDDNIAGRAKLLEEKQKAWIKSKGYEFK